MHFLGDKSCYPKLSVLVDGVLEHDYITELLKSPYSVYPPTGCPLKLFECYVYFDLICKKSLHHNIINLMLPYISSKFKHQSFRRGTICVGNLWTKGGSAHQGTQHYKQTYNAP